MITPAMPSTQIAGFARRVVLAFFSLGAVKRPAAGWSRGRPRIGFGTMIEVTSDGGISAAGSAPRSSGGENAVGTWGTSPGVHPGFGSCHGTGSVGRAPVGGAAKWVAPQTSSPAAGKDGSSSPEPGRAGLMGDVGSLTAPSTYPRLAGVPATRRPDRRDGRRSRAAAGPGRRRRDGPHHGRYRSEPAAARPGLAFALSRLTDPGPD